MGSGDDPATEALLNPKSQALRDSLRGQQGLEFALYANGSLRVHVHPL